MLRFVSVCLLAVALASPTFEEFKAQYGKVYASEVEEYFREHIYNTNVEYIHNFNKEGHSWTLGVNEYADLLHTEFVKRFLMAPIHVALPEKVEEIDVEALPASVDWRTKNAVSAVQTQGTCGSCYAFASTGALEGQHAINTGKLVALSAEDLLACSNAQGNQGCNGGEMTQCFQYVIDNNGIDTEASYPYTSLKGNVGKCKFNATNVGATATGFVSLPAGSESKLQNATALQGPIAVAMNGMLSSFQLYKSGIYAPANCTKTELSHSPLIVGYGTSTAEYWLVKNSWGTTWGMEGYFEIARNDGNMCGIASMPSFPTGVASL